MTGDRPQQRIKLLHNLAPGKTFARSRSHKTCHPHDGKSYPTMHNCSGFTPSEIAAVIHSNSLSFGESLLPLYSINIKSSPSPFHAKTSKNPESSPPFFSLIALNFSETFGGST